MSVRRNRVGIACNECSCRDAMIESLALLSLCSHLMAGTKIGGHNCRVGTTSIDLSTQSIVH